MASAAGGRAFAWAKGQVAVYPLFATVAFGVGLVGYITGRSLYTNPEVYVSKANRIEGPVDQDTKIKGWAQGYSSAIFRQMGEGQKKTIF